MNVNSETIVRIISTRLLIVDDDNNALQALSRLFRADEFQIFLAENGQQALQMLERQEVDVVISDMRMPSMDGAEFLGLVAERWPDVVRILLTGYADIEKIIAAVNNGKIFSYCQKPWDVDELKALVEKGVRQKRVAEEKRQLLDIINRQNAQLKEMNERLEARVEQRTEQLKNSLKRLSRIHQTLKNAQHMAHLGNWEWGISDNKLRCSDEAMRILGLDASGYGLSFRKLIRLVHADDRNEFIRFVRSLLQANDTCELLHRIVRGNGEERVLRLRAKFVAGGQGKLGKIDGVVHDITELQQAEIRSARMGRIFEHSWNEIYIVDTETLCFLDVSNGANHNLGYTEDEIRRLTLLDLMPEFSYQQLEAMFAPLYCGEKNSIGFESVCRRKDGSRYPVEVRLQLCQEEKPAVYLAIVQDISERKNYIEELERKALFDALTGLPNRSLLQDRLEHALSFARREAAGLAVLIVDIVRLREINDLLGHHNGDLVLQEVARRAAAKMRDSDTLARLGADEFVIVMPGVSRIHLPLVAKKIQNIFEPAFLIEGIPLELEAAVGIAYYPDHGDTSAQLVQHADIAVNVAKHETLGFSIYNPNNDPYSVRRLRLHGELRQAILDQKLVLYYQPKIELGNGRTTAVEALARWLHPSDGMISPAEFIPMVEQSGLIRPFTHWVLESVFRQAKEWHEKKLQVQIAVNISTRNLLDPDLVESIVKLLQRYRVDAERITLEITESSIMSRPEQALKVLNKLHGHGLKLSIDDFGTGYSSLAYLKQLPVSELKIDQSFVSDLTRNDSDEVIVRSTIGLAHNLGLCVVAEGVEDERTMQRLTELQCDMAQGYYFSRPVPAEQLTTKLLQEMGSEHDRAAPVRGDGRRGGGKPDAITS